MMHKNWQVTKHSCHKEPIPHIYCKNFIKLDLYDRLYEQWNNADHEHWKKIKKENNIEVHFHEDLSVPLKPKKTEGHIGYWFFRQRTDNSSGDNIVLSKNGKEKVLNYYQNTVLILDVKNNFEIKKRKNSLPTRPFCEIYFSAETDLRITQLLT